MEKEIRLPASGEEVRKLKVSDIVYVSGIVHTMRDMGHRRAVEMIKRGEQLPFNLKEGAIWHCGPIARKVGDTWEIVSAGPTSSSRFTELGAELVRKQHVRLTIGKGIMGKSMVEALREIGGVYLVATGGCAALYAKQVEKVENVYWLDLGMPEATWVLRVNKLGPLVVGIDSHGNTLEHIVLEKVHNNVNAIYAKEKIDPSRSYVWWPKKIPGSSDLTK
ncbi:MAG: FumA C-terminus/TtdB family hydratase beta subunit [Candidatus Bathyarchaeia archaeon]